MDRYIATEEICFDPNSSQGNTATSYSCSFCLKNDHFKLKKLIRYKDFWDVQKLYLNFTIL